MATEKVDLVTPFDTPSNPYGIVIDSKGTIWVAYAGQKKAGSLVKDDGNESADGDFVYTATAESSPSP